MFENTDIDPDDAKAGCAVLLLWLTISAAIGAFCWPYTINTWLVFLGKEPTFTVWQGALLGFVPGFGQASIGLAAFTWILMLFLL
jgi:hypothetical protein